MTRLGVWIVVLGIAALVLPHFGKQLVILSWLGSAAMPVAIGMVVGGAALAIVGWRKSKAAAGAAEPRK